MPTTGTLSLEASHHFDQQSILPDSVHLVNEAGYDLSISRLQYFLSGIRLHKADGTTALLKDILYVDMEAANKWRLYDIPAGTYTGISFLIGLDSANNFHERLPATPEHLNMEWPEPMGGGYHFLKMEGHYRDQDRLQGYAMHVGGNGFTIETERIPVSLTIGADAAALSLQMNVAEWFRNPHTYDFNLHGNYTMGDAPAMQMLTENGRDVLHR